jgi:EAL and modified HD-GYP domain-containing signal transduction protein
MDFFFLGMLSQFDVITQRPMAEILQSIDLAEDVRETLLDPAHDGPLRRLLEMVGAYEEADFDSVQEWCDVYRIEGEVLSILYVEAVEWADSLHRERRDPIPAAAAGR